MDRVYKKFRIFAPQLFCTDVMVGPPAAHD